MTLYDRWPVGGKPAAPPDATLELMSLALSRRNWAGVLEGAAALAALQVRHVCVVGHVLGYMYSTLLRMAGYQGDERLVRRRPGRWMGDSVRHGDPASTIARPAKSATPRRLI